MLKENTIEKLEGEIKNENKFSILPKSIVKLINEVLNKELHAFNKYAFIYAKTKVESNRCGFSIKEIKEIKDKNIDTITALLSSVKESPEVIKHKEAEDEFSGDYNDIVLDTEREIVSIYNKIAKLMYDEESFILLPVINKIMHREGKALSLIIKSIGKEIDTK